jgi:hypothetical protein
MLAPLCHGVGAADRRADAVALAEEWLHDGQCWVSTAAIDEVLEPTMWTETPEEPTE